MNTLELKKSELEAARKNLEALQNEIKELEEKESQINIGDYIVILRAEIDSHLIGKVNRIISIKDDGLIKTDKSTGYWHTKYVGKYFRKATDKEVEDYLIQEAEKKGFVKGAKVNTKPIWGNNSEWELIENHIRVTKSDTNIHLEVQGRSGCFSMVSIYKDGVWAELLPSTPSIQINGYKGEFFEDYVKFGCAEIDKDIFIKLSELTIHGKGNRKLQSVTIGYGTFNLTEINEIANHFKKEKP